MKTQAVVFPAADRFECRELTLAEPGPGDIVVRTLITAISPGTERWILRGKHIGTRFPCVPGYHRIGVVEHCGRAVTGLRPGMVVYGSANRWQDAGIVSMWGAHVGCSVSAPGGYRVLSETALPMEKLESLVFTILCGVSNRGINRAEVRAGDMTLHVGAGIVGVCAAQLAQGRGAVPVLLDRDPERIAWVTDAFPDIPLVDAGAGDWTVPLKSIAPAGFDLLHDTVGDATTTDALVPLVRQQGTLLLQAQYFDKQACALDLDAIKVRELTIKTTCGIREEDWVQTIDALSSERLDVQSLITHRLPADRVLDAYAMLHTGRPHSIGVVILW